MCTPTNSRTHDPKRSRLLEANTLQINLFGSAKGMDENPLDSISKAQDDGNEELRWVGTIQVY